MQKLLLVSLIMIAAGVSAEGPVHGTGTQGGLSGFLFLPGNDVLSTGLLRVQGRLDYLDVKDSDASYLVMPISAAWGVIENLEVGGEIPVYLDDPSEDHELLGDITAGCAWLYETARGGSSIVLRGQMRLPTGQSGRDRGTELDLGISTSTTFRLFRLQAAGSYVLNGQDNPFEDDIRDYMRFSIGGASYVTEDVQLVVSMDGSTWGELGLSGSGVFYSFDGFALFGNARLGLSGSRSGSISAGVSWTGSGF